MGPRRLLIVALGLSLCGPLLSSRVPMSQPESERTDATVNPRSFFLRNPSENTFELVPLGAEEEEEKNESVLLEGRAVY